MIDESVFESLAAAMPPAYRHDLPNLYVSQGQIDAWDVWHHEAYPEKCVEIPDVLERIKDFLMHPPDTVWKNPECAALGPMPVFDKVVITKSMPMDLAYPPGSFSIPWGEFVKERE